VAVFGALVLANVPADGPASSLSSRVLDGASIATFTHVFIGIACTMTVAFFAMLVIEEKPLGPGMPAPRR
jgi:hypothetical protein